MVVQYQSKHSHKVHLYDNKARAPYGLSDMRNTLGGLMYRCLADRVW